MKIFLSYSHTDAELADRIKSDLEKFGLSVWSDRGEILPGEPWAEKIQAAIESSEDILFIVPAKNETSGWLSAEVALSVASKARDSKKRLIPIITSRSSDIPFFLKQYQALDLSNEEQYRVKVNELANLLNKERPPQEELWSSGRIELIKAQASALELMQKQWQHEQVSANRMLILRFITDGITFILGTIIMTVMIKSGILGIGELPTILYVILGAIGGFGIARFVPQTIDRIARSEEVRK
jgi:hypothetical protein